MLEVLLTAVFVIFFIILTRKMKFFRLDGFSKNTITGLYLIKLFAGIALALIYTYYYTDRQTSDIYKYFDDGEIIYQTLFSSPLEYFQIIFGFSNDNQSINEVLAKTNYWYKPFESVIYNDNRTIIKYNALVRTFSFGSIGVHTTILCFLSFFGLTAIYKICIRKMKDKKKELLFAIYLLPSVLFWGSGLLKEGILLFALGGFLYFYFKIIHESIQIKNIISFILFAILLFHSKIYVLFALIPALVAYLTCKIYKSGNPIIKHTILYTFLFILAMNIHLIIPEINILDVIIKKQYDFINVALLSKAGSYYQIPILESNAFSFISIFPNSVFNVLFRPSLFDISSPIILLAAIENIIIILIIAFCLAFFKWKPKHLNFTLFCIGFVLILFGIIGMTTPILGALVRYKIPGLPFLMIFFIFYYNKAKALNKFPILKFLK